MAGVSLSSPPDSPALTVSSRVGSPNLRTRSPSGNTRTSLTERSVAARPRSGQRSPAASTRGAPPVAGQRSPTTITRDITRVTAASAAHQRVPPAINSARGGAATAPTPARRVTAHAVPAGVREAHEKVQPRTASPGPATPPKTRVMKPLSRAGSLPRISETATSITGKETEPLLEEQASALAAWYLDGGSGGSRGSVDAPQPDCILHHDEGDDHAITSDAKEPIQRMVDPTVKGLDDLFYLSWLSQQDQPGEESAADFATGLVRGDTNKLLICLSAIHKEILRNAADVKTLKDSHEALQCRVQKNEEGIEEEKLKRQFAVQHAVQHNLVACRDVEELKRRLDQEVLQLQAQSQAVSQFVEALDRKLDTLAPPAVSPLRVQPPVPHLEVPPLGPIWAFTAESGTARGTARGSPLTSPLPNSRVSRISAANVASAHPALTQLGDGTPMRRVISPGRISLPVPVGRTSLPAASPGRNSLPSPSNGRRPSPGRASIGSAIHRQASAPASPITIFRQPSASGIPAPTAVEPVAGALASALGWNPSSPLTSSRMPRAASLTVPPGPSAARVISPGRASLPDTSVPAIYRHASSPSLPSGWQDVMRHGGSPPPSGRALSPTQPSGRGSLGSLTAPAPAAYRQTSTSSLPAGAHDVLREVSGTNDVLRQVSGKITVMTLEHVVDGSSPPPPPPPPPPALSTPSFAEGPRVQILIPGPLGQGGVGQASTTSFTAAAPAIYHHASA